MALNAGSIFVELAYKYNDRGMTQFERDGRKAKQTSQGLGTQNKKTGASFKAVAAGAMTAAAGGLALSKAYQGIKTSVKTTEELTRATAKFGSIVKTDNVTAAKWIMLAKERGLEGKQLNQSFITLSKNMEAARNGGEKQTEMFKKLGVSQEMLKRGDATEVLMTASDAFAKMGPGAERAALVQQMFARGGQSLIGVISKGSGALGEQLGKFDEQAKALAKNKDATMDQVEAQREFQRQMLQFQVAVGTAVMPALTSLTRMLTQLGKSSPETLRALGALAMAAVAAIGIGKLAAAMNALKVAMMTNPWGLIAMAIAVAAVLIITHWDKVKKVLGNVWNWMKKTFKDVANFIGSAARKGFLGPVPLIISRWGEIKEFFKRLPKAIVGFFSGIGGKIVRPFVSAFTSLKKAIGDAIAWTKKAFSNGVNWLNNAYQKLPGWVKKLISAGGAGASFVISKLTGKAKGGKVGPGAGGPQVYVAGEGGKDEWVISQEGDRKKNIGYALEALGALGAQGFKLGGRVRGSKSRADRFASQRDTMERNYSIAQRAYELSGDGIDAGEYASLEKMRTKINANRASESSAIGKALGFAKKDADRLKRQISRTRGKKQAKLKEQLQEINEFRKEYAEKRRQLGFEIREGSLDLIELRNQAAQAAAKETEAATGAESSGPSLAEQFASFNSSRFDLLRSFGSNASSLPASTMATAAAPAAGGKGAPTIVNNYTTAPPDPAAWNKQMELQIKAAA